MRGLSKATPILNLGDLPVTHRENAIETSRRTRLAQDC